jgi:muramidase (phage lysozyme)
MSGGSGSTQSTSSWSPTPQMMQNYMGVVDLAKQAAATPYTPYGGEMVAPLSPTQQAGISNVNASVGTALPAIYQGMQNVQGGMNAAMPYYNAATGSIQGGINAAMPLQQQAQYGYQNALNMAQPYQNLATNLSLGSAGAVTPQQYSPEAVQQYMSPYMNNVVNATMAQLQNQQGQQRAALQGNAISAGAFGGDRAGIAQAELANQQNLASGQTLSNLLQGGYTNAQQMFGQQQGVNLAAQQANRAAQAAAAGQLGAIGQQGYGQQLGAAQQQAALGQQLYGQGLSTAQQQAALGQGLYGMGLGGGQALAGLGTQAQTAALQGAQAQLAAGAQQQAYQQALDSAMQGLYQQGQAYPFQSTQYLANIIEGIGAGTGGTSTATQPGPNVASQIFGGLGALSLISDPRMKDNMEPVGKTFDGQNIYKFNYKGSPTTQIGLNAAETEHHKPEAVSRTQDGIRAVNYDIATEDAAKRGHFALGGLASMGGGVVPSMERQAYPTGGSVDSSELTDLIQQLYGKANPGIGMIPYGQTNRTPYANVRGYIPSTQIPVGKNTIPQPPKVEQDTTADNFLQQLLKTRPGSGSLQGGLGNISSGFNNLGNTLSGTGGSYGFATGNEPGFARGGLVGYREHHDGSEGNVVGTTPPQTSDTTPDQTPDQPQFKIQPQSVDDMNPIQQMIVHTIYHGESGGKYNILNGGETFDPTKGHPNRVGEGGTSTAAGAGQFIKGTWDDVTGGAPMTPEYQDAATLTLAKRDYKARTGNDLEADIQKNGFTPEMRAALAPTFTSFGPKQGVAAAGQADKSGVAGADQRTLLENVLGRNLDPATRQSLLAGFLGMMASKSPYFGSAIGEGGVAAIGNYQNQMQLARENALAQAKFQQEQQRVGYEGQRVGLEGQKYGLEAKQFGFNLYKNDIGQYTAQYVDDGAGGTKLQYLAPDNTVLSPAQFQAEKIKIMRGYGLTPTDVGESATMSSAATSGQGAASTAVNTAKNVIQSAGQTPAATAAATTAAQPAQAAATTTAPPAPATMTQAPAVTGQPTATNDILQASIKAQQDRYESLKAQSDAIRKNAATMTKNPEQQKVEYARANEMLKLAQDALGQTFQTPAGNTVRLQPGGPAFNNPPPPPLSEQDTGLVDNDTGVVKTNIPNIGYPLTGGHPTESLPSGVVRTAPDPNLASSQKASAEQEAEMQQSIAKTKDAIPALLKFSSAAHFIEGGGLSTNRIELANQAKGLGFDDIANQILSNKLDIAAGQIAIKTSVSNAVAQVSANFARPTQSEFNTTEQKATPNIDQINPASLSLAETQLAATLSQNSLWKDWTAFKQQNPNGANYAAFAQNWRQLNKPELFEKSAQSVLGNFKGMPLPNADKLTAQTVYIMPNQSSPKMAGYSSDAEPNTQLYKALLDKGIQPGDKFVFTKVDHNKNTLGGVKKIDGDVTAVYQQMLKHPALVFGG